MIKYYKNDKDLIIKLEENEANTIAQLLCYNPELREEVTEKAYNAQEAAIAAAPETISNTRASEYSELLPTGDQMDALWKALDALAKGEDLPLEAINVMAIRDMIKDDHPYV